MRRWAGAKAKWLATFLDVPGDLPSHNTFGRVFASLDPAALGRRFATWVGGAVGPASGRLVVVDGKAVRRSFAQGQDKSGMARLVSTFVCQGENRLEFAQAMVDERANEVVAIPKMLALVDLAGAVGPQDAVLPCLSTLSAIFDSVQQAVS